MKLSCPIIIINSSYKNTRLTLTISYTTSGPLKISNHAKLVKNYKVINTFGKSPYVFGDWKRRSPDS